MNQSKGDRDPAAWNPPLTSFYCTYARAWISVKYKWGLSLQSRALTPFSGPADRNVVGGDADMVAHDVHRWQTGCSACPWVTTSCGCGRSYRADWSPTLGLSYSAIISPDVPLGGQNDQPPKWFGLGEEWESVFPEDHGRIRAYVRRLAAERSDGVR